MNRENKPNWIRIISFIASYLLGIITYLVFREKILECIQNFLLSIL